MKVSELQDAELDYWVAKAEGLPVVRLECGDGFECYPDEAPLSAGYYYKFSRSWAEAGPIIEREKIATFPVWYAPASDFAWGATEPGYAVNYSAPMAVGPTPLIAAMRAYVASKFGEEVPDQESQ